jgi:primosomal protein N' (replication factor Y)
VLGTRLAVLASLPHLKLIVIDEEHDPRTSSRKACAIRRATWPCGAPGSWRFPIVLGSATPSLESWHHAQSGATASWNCANARSRHAVLPHREAARHGARQAEGRPDLAIGRGAAPAHGARRTVAAVPEPARLCAGDLLRILRLDQRLHALHLLHGAAQARTPAALPPLQPGDAHSAPLPDLRQRRPAAAGRGTQRVEEGLQALFPEARILRIDADSTRRKGSAQEAFDTVHRGEVDILIGTQMVAKGHDFKKLTLVGILNPGYGAVLAGLPRQRAPVRAADAGGGPRRPRRAEGRRQRQRSADPDPLSAASAVRAVVQPRLRPLCHFGLLEERKQAACRPICTRPAARRGAGAGHRHRVPEQARDCVEHPGITINDPIPMT